MKRYLFAAIAVITAFPLVADEVHLKNQDVIHGTIVKKEGGKLTVKTELLGTVTLDWDQVVEIKSTTPLHVALPNNQNVTGPVDTTGGRLTVGTTTAPLADVTTLRDDAAQKAYDRLLKPGLFDLWTITGAINFAGTKGNAQTTTFTTPINFARTTNTSTTTAYFNAIKSSATINGVNASTAQAVRGGWAFSRNLEPKLFANVFNDYEYDRFQNLDLRVVLGGGAGYHVWKGERGMLDATVGIDWNHESFDPSPLPKFTRSSAEFFWGNNFAYKLSARTNLTQSYRMFNNLTDTGAYRQNFDLTASTQIVKWLTWNIGLSDRYLSNPAPGRKTNDFLYTTGFGFSFAR